MSGDLERGRRDARGLRSPRSHDVRDARRASPASRASSPQGAFYAFPLVRGRARAHESRAHGRRRPLELAELLLEEAKVAIVPGEAFGAPGYARLSFALGDDDLVEGITRIDKLLAE